MKKHINRERGGGITRFRKREWRKVKMKKPCRSVGRESGPHLDTSERNCHAVRSYSRLTHVKC